MKKIKHWLGRHLYFLPDTWIYRKIVGLPVVNINIEESQVIISNALNQQKPVLIARLGGNELDFVYNYGMRGRKLSDNLVRELKITAGVFDIETTISKEYLKSEYLNAIPNIDVLVSWRKEEKYLNFDLIPKIRLTDLELFRASQPFTKLLKGVILLVSPFCETMKLQIEIARKEQIGTVYKLFDLNNVKFVFYKPLQTHGSIDKEDIESWRSALEYQKSQISQISFDTALISCGAYGVPIGNFIKCNLGRNAIVVGGVLQLYFDIIGRRWEKNIRVMNALDQRAIVRPSIQEIPQNHMDIESSAYF